jgi:hypothetical protein
MSQLSIPSHDKSTWGPGPWQTEPDLQEWRHAGLPCLAKRVRLGNWCGYVGVPSGHPDHGKGYDELEVEVHGGLTFSESCSEVACHVPAPGESDDFFWFGFDCLHFNDYAPGWATSREPGYGQGYGNDPRNLQKRIYRDLAYVTAETNRLADQLAARA